MVGAVESELLFEAERVGSGRHGCEVVVKVVVDSEWLMKMKKLNGSYTIEWLYC